MVDVNFGNFVTVNGKTISTGSQTGIDTNALIESLVAARSIPIDNLRDDQTEINDQISAFGEFNTLLGSLQGSLSFLRNPPGVNAASQNAFDYRQAILTSSDGSSSSNYLTVTAAPGADIGSIDIEIQQVAQAKQLRTADLSAISARDADITGTGTGEVTSGTFQINGEDVVVEDGDTLETIVSKINTITGDTNVKASIIQADDADFRLVLTSTVTGTVNDFTLTGADAVFGVGAFDTVQTADDAIFEVDDLQITRSTNTIDDVIEGLTFSLFQATPDFGGPSEVSIRLDVDENIQTPFDEVLNFVAAYNELKIFLAKQNERDEDGILLDTAVLGSSSLTQTLESQFAREASDVVDGLTDVLNKLSDVGITFTDLEADAATETPFTRNVLTVDQDALLNALQTDFSGVRGVFEFQLSSDADDKLTVFSRTNALAATSFALDIDDSRGAGDEVRVTYDIGNGPETVNATLEGSAGNFKIIGNSGTAIEGLELVYVGDGTDVINVTVTQGIADRLYNAATAAVEDDGLIDTEVASLGDSEERVADDIERLEGLLVSFQDSLITRFAGIEEALAQVNSTLAFLEAQDAAREANN